MARHPGFENADRFTELCSVVKRQGQSMVPCIDPLNRIDLVPDRGGHLIARQQGKVQNANRPAALIAMTRTVHVPVEHATELVLSAGRATVEPGHVVLGPLSGALVR